jgi:hypothetical protein
MEVWNLIGPGWRNQRIVIANYLEFRKRGRRGMVKMAQYGKFECLNLSNQVFVQAARLLWLKRLLEKNESIDE